MVSQQLPKQAVERIDPAEWVEAYGDYLYRYAFSRLRDANSAEETVQETFLAGIRYHSQFSGKGAEQSWLLGILKRKIVDFVRRRERHNRAAAYEDEMDPTTQLFDAKGNWRADAIPWSTRPDQQAESKELWQIVRECLTQLPSNQADVFVLSVMEQIDSDEICKQLEITPSNLWVRMHRARLGLAKCVGPQWNFDDDNVSSGKTEA